MKHTKDFTLHIKHKQNISKCKGYFHFHGWTWRPKYTFLIYPSFLRTFRPSHFQLLRIFGWFRPCFVIYISIVYTYNYLLQSQMLNSSPANSRDTGKSNSGTNIKVKLISVTKMTLVHLFNKKAAIFRGRCSLALIVILLKKCSNGTNIMDGRIDGPRSKF